MLCSISIQSTISAAMSGVGKYGIAWSPRISQSSKYCLNLSSGSWGQSFTNASLCSFVGKADWGPLSFNLGNAYLLVRRIHKEIEGVQRSQLERELLMLLDGIIDRMPPRRCRSFGPHNKRRQPGISPIPSRRTTLSSNQKNLPSLSGGHAS